MRRLLLASAAMASLAIGLATAQAQQAQDHERMPAASRSQQSAAQADQKRNRASARDQRGASQTGKTNNGMPRDALDARAQKDKASPGQTEPLRSNQARERVRRDTRNRTQ